MIHKTAKDRKRERKTVAREKKCELELEAWQVECQTEC